MTSLSPYVYSLKQVLAISPFVNMKICITKQTILWLADCNSNMASCHSTRCKSRRCCVGKERWQEEQTYRCNVL